MTSQTDPALDDSTRSRVEYYGPDKDYCGYCKSINVQNESKISVGMRAKRLLANDYQLLSDLGWRRSGTYCYHPINKMTCCPNYAILCRASELKLSRSQRRCIANLNSFILNDNISDKFIFNFDKQNHEKLFSKTVSQQKFEELQKSPKAKDRRFVASCKRKVKLNNIRLEEAIKIVIAKNIGKQRDSASLEDYLYPMKGNLTSQESKHKLEVKLLHVDSDECKSFRSDENELIKRYQKAVHREEESEWTMSRYCGFLVDTPIVVEKIKNVPYSEEDDTLTTNIHNNTDSYLITKPPNIPTSYGTYHCLYLLDGKLIAVGVLDVLPKCITTVYFFYEPEYSFLNLGVYSALTEISLVRTLTKYFASANEPLYYHLGYYVHECKKMRYKTRFRPSYLLCSEAKRYEPTENCLRKLSTIKYTRFSDDSIPNFDETFNGPQVAVTQVFKIPVDTPVTNTSKMIDYIQWLQINLDDDSADRFFNCILEYVRLVGPDLSKRMILEVNLIHKILVKIHARKNDRGVGV